MFRGTLLLATLGLASNVMLWSVPALVGAGPGLPHALFPSHAPSLAQALTSAEHTTGPVPSLLDGFLQLIGAESEALQVASLGLQQPTPPDLAPRANQAGARVLDAVSTYVRSAQAVVGH